jgi:hypothetical protein
MVRGSVGLDSLHVGIGRVVTLLQKREIFLTDIGGKENRLRAQKEQCGQELLFIVREIGRRGGIPSIEVGK